MAIVELPDGSTVEFPDDMPPAQINAEIETFLAQQASPPQAEVSDGPSLNLIPTADSIPRGLQVGAQKVGRGLAELAGMPADLAVAGANLPLQAADIGGGLLSKLLGAFGVESDLGVDFRFPPSPLGSDSIANTASEIASEVGLDTIPDSELSPGERAVGNAERFITQGLGLTTGLVREATRRATTDGARVMPRALDSLLRPIQQNPNRALAGDIAADAGSGVALTAVRDLLPKEMQGPIADTLAMLLGGVSGNTALNVATAPKKAAGAAASRLTSDAKVPVDPDTGLPISNATADRGARFVQDNVTGNAAEVAETNLRVARDLNNEAGVIPTAGAATGDIGLTAVERGFRSKDPVPFEVRDQALKDAAQESVESLKKPGDPLKATARAEAEAAARIGEADANVGAVTTRQAEVANANKNLGDELAANAGTAAEASKKLDGIVRSTVDEIDADSTRRFTSIDPEGQVVLDAAPLGRLVDDVRESIPQLVPEKEVLPESFLQQFEKVAGREDVNTGVLDASGAAITRSEGGEITFKELNQARPFLADAVKSAETAGSFTLARNLRALKSYLDDVTEELATSGSPAGARAQDALENFKVKVKPIARDGEVGKFRQDIKNDPGGVKTRPTETADRFMLVEESAQDLARVLQASKNPSEGFAAARQWVLDNVSGMVDAKGNVNGNRLDKWVKNHKGVLDQVPGLRDELQTTVRKARQGDAAADGLAQELKSAQAARKQTEEQLNRSAAGALLRGEDPQKVASGILNSGPNIAPGKMAEMRALMEGDAEAMAGWKRAVADEMVDRVTSTNTALSSGAEGTVRLAALSKQFRANEKTLANVFSPKEMQALRRGHKMLEPLGNLNRRASVGSPTVENEALWNSVEAGLLAVTGNAITTGMIMKRVRVALKFLPDQQKQVARLVERAYFDPELMAHLLTKDVKKINGPTWNAKLNRLLAVGEAARTSQREDDTE